MQQVRRWLTRAAFTLGAVEITGSKGSIPKSKVLQKIGDMSRGNYNISIYFIIFWVSVNWHWIVASIVEQRWKNGWVSRLHLESGWILVLDLQPEWSWSAQVNIFIWYFFSLLNGFPTPTLFITFTYRYYIFQNVLAMSVSLSYIFS